MDARNHLNIQIIEIIKELKRKNNSRTSTKHKGE